MSLPRFCAVNSHWSGRLGYIPQKIDNSNPAVKIGFTLRKNYLAGKVLAVISKFFEHDGITIYCGNCGDILPSLGVFDAVVTDPPYGLGDKWNGGAGGDKSSWKIPQSEAKQWDMSPSEHLPEVLKHGRQIIVWGGNYYNLPPARCWLIWDKKQPDTWTTGQAEMAWTNLDRPVRMFRMSQVEAHSEMGHKCHPTQKPLSLMSWCIAMVNEPVATVLDPFAGSGTTLRAAKDRGLKAVGIELDERYCEIAAERLGQEVLDFGGVA